MTLRQKILLIFYPWVMPLTRFFGNTGRVFSNSSHAQPKWPIYRLSVSMNSGRHLSLADFVGKKLLLVNTASDCGYTPQYAELQQLYERYREKLVVIGFPANDFKEQEKGTDEEIARFCEVNFGVTFPLAQKSTVVKGAGQNNIFHWLTDKELNGWNDQEPTWNFSKYLINGQGALTHYFDPSVSPLGKEVIAAVESGH